MDDIEELKLLEKILLLIKDYNETYKPEIYDSKVDLKAVKRSWIKNEEYGTMELRHWEIGLEEVQNQIREQRKINQTLDDKS
jgi:hypothetical protein